MQIKQSLKKYRVERITYLTTRFVAKTEFWASNKSEATKKLKTMQSQEGSSFIGDTYDKEEISAEETYTLIENK